MRCKLFQRSSQHSIPLPYWRLFVSRTRIMTALSLAMLALGAGSHTRIAYSQASSSEIVILSTGAIQGELAPCG